METFETIMMVILMTSSAMLCGSLAFGVTYAVYKLTVGDKGDKG